jgi:hypothetical protein
MEVPGSRRSNALTRVNLNIFRERRFRWLFHLWSFASVRHRKMGQFATLLVATAMLLLTSIGAAENLARPTPPSLVVTPPASMAFSGPQDGPFSPSSFQYRVSASTGTVSYSIRTPSWLTASSSFGVTDTSGVTITLTINARASRLPPGTYGPGVAFTNVTNGQGSATRSATLIIQAPSPPASPPRHVPDSRGGYLLDSHGRYLLDEGASRLLAR